MEVSAGSAAPRPQVPASRISASGASSVGVSDSDPTPAGSVAEDLKSLLEQLAPTLDILPDAVRAVDLDGKAAYVNRSFLQMTGYSPSEILGRPIENSYYDEDRPRVTAFLSGLYKTGRVSGTLEVRILRKGGEPVMVSLNCTGLKNSRGQMIGGLAIFRDMGRLERIIAEPVELLNLAGSPVEILRQLPARVATFFPGRPWVMITLVEGDYLRFAYAINVPAELMAQGGELLEESVCGIVIKSGSFLGIGDMATDDRTRRDPCVTQYGCRGYLGYPILDASGKILGTICILRPHRGGFGEYDHRVLRMFAKRAAMEIERMALESRIQESENDVWELVENAPIMIWRIDLDGRIKMISRKGREELGYENGETVQDSWFDLIHPDDLHGVRSKIDGASSTPNGLLSTPIRLRKRDGGYGNFFTTIRPIRDLSGKVKLLEGITFQIPAEDD